MTTARHTARGVPGAVMASSRELGEWVARILF
jgi:hypothetical protein